MVLGCMLYSHWMTCVWYAIVAPNNNLKDYTFFTGNKISVTDQYFFSLQHVMSLILGNSPASPFVVSGVIVFRNSVYLVDAGVGFQ